MSGKHTGRGKYSRNQIEINTYLNTSAQMLCCSLYKKDTPDIRLWSGTKTVHARGVVEEGVPLYSGLETKIHRMFDIQRCDLPLFLRR